MQGVVDTKAYGFHSPNLTSLVQEATLMTSNPAMNFLEPVEFSQNSQFDVGSSESQSLSQPLTPEILPSTTSTSQEPSVSHRKFVQEGLSKIKKERLWIQAELMRLKHIMTSSSRKRKRDDSSPSSSPSKRSRFEIIPSKQTNTTPSPNNPPNTPQSTLSLKLLLRRVEMPPRKRKRTSKSKRRSIEKLLQARRRNVEDALNTQDDLGMDNFDSDDMSSESSLHELSAEDFPDEDAYDDSPFDIQLPVLPSNLLSKNKTLDPFMNGHKKSLVALLGPIVSQFKGFSDQSSRKGPGSGWLEHKPLSPKTHSKKKKKPMLLPKASSSLGTVTLGRWTLSVNGKIGEGAFATVFRAKSMRKFYALKIQPPNGIPHWEWYVGNTVHRRIGEQRKKEGQTGPDLRRSFVKFHSLMMYEDRSVILMEHSERGTLQDAINLYLDSGKRMEEAVVVFYTLELLRIVEGLRSIGIIHCDVKPDNFLIRGGDSTELSMEIGSLVLIDYGRSIDTHLYPPDTQFTGDCHVEGFACVEMMQGMPWTFQPDIFGVCAVVHCLLHGTYMELAQDGRTRRWHPKEGFKRYWASEELWKPFFDEMINMESSQKLPDLAGWVRRFERWLERNPGKADLVPSFLQKQDALLAARRS